MNEKTKKGDILITLWIAFGVMIILGFFIFTMIIGGSAGNGYLEAGKYYVCDHGNCVEVSETIWMISSVLEILFWVFVPLTPIGAFVISNIQEKIDLNKEKQVF